MQPVMFTGYKPVPHHGLETGAPPRDWKPVPHTSQSRPVLRAVSSRQDRGRGATGLRTAWL